MIIYFFSAFIIYWFFHLFSLIVFFIISFILQMPIWFSPLFRFSDWCHAIISFIVWYFLQGFALLRFFIDIGIRDVCWFSSIFDWETFSSLMVYFLPEREFSSFSFIAFLGLEIPFSSSSIYLFHMMRVWFRWVEFSLFFDFYLMRDFHFLLSSFISIFSSSIFQMILKFQLSRVYFYRDRQASSLRFSRVDRIVFISIRDYIRLHCSQSFFIFFSRGAVSREWLRDIFERYFSFSSSDFLSFLLVIFFFFFISFLLLSEISSSFLQNVSFFLFFRWWWYFSWGFQLFNIFSSVYLRGQRLETFMRLSF